MAEQLAYTLLAAALGFVAALYFCFGAALLRHKTMVVLATTYWDYNPIHATAVVSQSAQYAVGAVLLLAAFVLQIVAALASPSALLVSNPLFRHPVVFLVVALLAVEGASYLAYRRVLHWRLVPVLQELEANINASQAPT